MKPFIPFFIFLLLLTSCRYIKYSDYNSKVIIGTDSLRLYQIEKKHVGKLIKKVPVQFGDTLLSSGYWQINFCDMNYFKILYDNTPYAVIHGEVFTLDESELAKVNPFRFSAPISKDKEIWSRAVKYLLLLEHKIIQQTDLFIQTSNRYGQIKPAYTIFKEYSGENVIYTVEAEEFSCYMALDRRCAYYMLYGKAAPFTDYYLPSGNDLF